MALAGHQLSRAFAVTSGTSAAHEAAVVQEEPQQIGVVQRGVTGAVKSMTPRRMMAPWAWFKSG